MLITALAIGALALSTAGPDAPGRVELVRDQWGTPHVFAETDAGAFYGLGYAAAEDRGLQMHYSLRIIKGRLAELVGDVKKVGREETAVESDRKMRTIGFEQAAWRVAAGLEAESRALLQAYSEGVNAYFKEHEGRLHEGFDRVGLKPEPWTPSDCLLSWWHLAQFFATDGTRDLLALKNQAQGMPRAGGVGFEPDDSTAVVQRGDVSAEWIEQVGAFLESHGHDRGAEGGQGSEEGPKFSHAWVVDGKASGTGGAVLVSEPRTPVANPSLLYEFHVKGASFNARGVGVAGSPIVLIGWNEWVAWGMTALGADQADLFRLATDEKRPEQYWFDGEWLDLDVERVEIGVKGEQARPLVIRRSHLGPIVNEFAFAGPEDPLVALVRVPTAEVDRDTITAGLAMMRSRTINEFYRALEGWRFPSANVVFGDKGGRIGFSLVGAIPLRSSAGDVTGGVAHDGSGQRFLWRERIPHELMPHVVEPERPVLFSANHRPVGAFYPAPLGTSTGSMGDTLRSWRLRELLGDGEELTAERMKAIRLDSVNPARRAIVGAGLYLRDRGKGELSEDCLAALKILEGWREAGSKSDLEVVGSALAMEINTMFRLGNTRLAGRFGGGESGLSRYLKTVERRIADEGAVFDAEEVAWIDRVLAEAWRGSVVKYGNDSAGWQVAAKQAARERSLGYLQSLDGFGSVDSELDLSGLPIRCPDGGTIWSQNGQAYSQFVPLADLDSALSILPPGNSERPGDLLRTVNVRDWERGEMHAAPLSREGVRRVQNSERVLLP